MCELCLEEWKLAEYQRSPHVEYLQRTTKDEQRGRDDCKSGRGGLGQRASWLNEWCVLACERVSDPSVRTVDELCHAGLTQLKIQESVAYRQGVQSTCMNIKREE